MKAKKSKKPAKPRKGDALAMGRLLASFGAEVAAGLYTWRVRLADEGDTVVITLTERKRK